MILHIVHEGEEQNDKVFVLPNDNAFAIYTWW